MIFFDNQLNLVGDTDTLDLDPRSFSQRLDIVEFEVLTEKKTKEITEKKNINVGNNNVVSPVSYTHLTLPTIYSV